MKRVRIRWIAAIAMLAASGSVHAQTLREGFSLEEVATGLDVPTDVAFAADGRMFVIEQEGAVWVFEDGQRRPEPFIDLTDEVNGLAHRGMLGIALAPDFMTSRTVYLLYTVDPVYGEPDDPREDGTFGRLTSYVGTVESGGSVADPASRNVLLGDPPSTGLPLCWSHTVGSLQFGLDGTLFVASGDGSHSDPPDTGGNDPNCFSEGMFGDNEDIGAFRAQYLDSLGGKILRIDPATGLGLPTNPFWTGDGADKRSRIWANGLRNPYRMSIRPGSPSPGTLYIGDVGWHDFEEINVARGGENFGWPCLEAFETTTGYPDENPPHGGCDLIETPENPGPLTYPMTTWHHRQGSRSVPPGIVGQCSVGGAFYDGSCWPELYHGAYLYVDLSGWIRAGRVDDEDRLVRTELFATDLQGGAVALTPDPHTGDLYIVSFVDGAVRRIVYDTLTCTGDITCNGAVGVDDLLEVLSGWGPCGACPPDLDRDGVVSFGDVLVLLSAWGPCSP